MKGTCKSLTKLEYHLEEFSKAKTVRLDWHNPEGKPYPFDLNDTQLQSPRQNLLLMISNGLKIWPVVYRFPKRLKIQKKYDYGNLEEIDVRRDDQKLYKFRESDFSRLHLSYLRNRTAYTSYSNPQAVIYVDNFDRKRLMCTDELHKFSDGTLNDVRTALHDISKGIRMEYLPKRKWSGLEKKRAWVMVQDIDKQLFERRLMRNLEKFVGGREYRNDLGLLERTI
ncbi:hypothetical protein Tco_1525912 [Tanacetum coccineum]